MFVPSYDNDQAFKVLYDKYEKAYNRAVKYGGKDYRAKYNKLTYTEFKTEYISEAVERTEEYKRKKKGGSFLAEQMGKTDARQLSYKQAKGLIESGKVDAKSISKLMYMKAENLESVHDAAGARYHELIASGKTWEEAHIAISQEFYGSP